MIKREAKFTVLFRHWMMANPCYECCAFELKQTQKDYINFKEIQEHQIDALMAVKHGAKGLLWKLPDDSRGIKPFDLFYLKNASAYVVIKYPKMFCLIDIDKFCSVKKTSGQASLNSYLAEKIATQVVKL